MPREEVRLSILWCLFNSLLLTICLVKARGDHSYCLCTWVEPVHLDWKDRCRSKVLKVAIQRIRKVDVLVARVDGDVVERVELAAVKVVGENRGIVGRHWVDGKERRRRLIPHALAGEENVALVVCTS